MMRHIRITQFAAIVYVTGCLLVSMPAAVAEQRYVTDQFEVTLRSGPSSKHAIQRLVKSGAPLELLEHDTESDYSKVKMGSGVEGWVLTRYLMREPTARTQLVNLVKQFSDTEPEGSLSNQINLIKSEYAKINDRVMLLESEKQQLEQQLAEIKNTAANVLAIDSENQQLHQKFVETKSQLETLQAENATLNSSQDKEWFITGALVLLGGLLLGLIIPKISWGRRSRYGGF